MNHIQLRDEALRIVDDLQLMALLKPFGKPLLVGSVALDLVVKRDIDIQILVPREQLVDIGLSISRLLLDKADVKHVRISDWRELNSLKIGIDDYRGVSGNWSIDMWVTSDPSTLAYERTQQILQALRPVHRKSILAIKRYYYRKKQLRNGLSAAIYDAVLCHKVRTIEQFISYQARLNR